MNATTRCRRTVYWFAEDLTGYCQLPAGHPGAHCDGLWLFDDDGLRVPRLEADMGRPALVPPPKPRRPVLPCPICGRPFRPNSDGTIRLHRLAGGARTCPGSRRAPRGLAA